MKICINQILPYRLKLNHCYICGFLRMKLKVPKILPDIGYRLQKKTSGGVKEEQNQRLWPTNRKIKQTATKSQLLPTKSYKNYNSVA